MRHLVLVPAFLSSFCPSGSDGEDAKGAAPQQATIATDFPGGNIVQERIEGDDVFEHQDLRDTKGDWFYWCFAVRSAAGRELTWAAPRPFRSDLKFRMRRRAGPR